MENSLTTPDATPSADPGLWGAATEGHGIVAFPFPLRAAQEGERVKILALKGGPGYADRLAGLGLHPGATLDVLCNPMDGTLVVALEGSRLFLGGGMAQKIQVEIVKGMGQ